jgi:hypothetical protein
MIIVLIVVIIDILSVFKLVKKICKCKSQMNVISLEAVGSPTVQEEDGTLSSTTDPLSSSSGFVLRVQSTPQNSSSGRINTTPCGISGLDQVRKPVNIFSSIKCDLKNEPEELFVVISSSLYQPAKLNFAMEEHHPIETT